PATGALVLGIIAFVTTLVFINYILGLIALILGICYLCRRRPKFAKGRAIVGIVFASLSIIASSALWYSVYNYFANTSIVDIVEDAGKVVEKVTGQEVNVGTIVDDAINNTITDALGGQEQADLVLEPVEKLLGQELSYDAICEFVGEEVTVKKITNFVGNGNDVNELTNVIENVNSSALIEDMGGSITYKAMEEKLGEDFTYQDLLEYIKQFQ
ncbi:MAG: DUF4190 domain-containing protein, partial [Agathobacter sp.]|nr:DUF4190 domain-containing protein [Agathobacter sp.]